MSFIAAGIGAAGSIVSGVIGANAARDAADQKAQAAREANALQEKMYNQGRADSEPWRAAGGRALAGMESADFQRDFTASDFQKDPGYDFRMAEGQKALERSAAARGGLQSGGMMKALTRYGQGVASEEYGNAYNRFNADRDRRFGRLATISGQGLGAVGQSIQAGQNYASQVGANTMGAAEAAGNAGMAQAGAFGSAISGVTGAVNDGMAMKRQAEWMKKWNSSQSAPAASGYGGGRTFGLLGRK